MLGEAARGVGDGPLTGGGFWGKVAKVRPADPIDYLAEYLFNADPQLS